MLKLKISIKLGVLDPNDAFKNFEKGCSSPLPTKRRLILHSPSNFWVRFSKINLINY
jgi:hypothetical protein